MPSSTAAATNSGTASLASVQVSAATTPITSQNHCTFSDSPSSRRPSRRSARSGSTERLEPRLTQPPLRHCTSRLARATKPQATKVPSNDFQSAAVERPLARRRGRLTASGTRAVLAGVRADAVLFWNRVELQYRLRRIEERLQLLRVLPVQ